MKKIKLTKNDFAHLNEQKLKPDISIYTQSRRNFILKSVEVAAIINYKKYFYASQDPYVSGILLNNVSSLLSSYCAFFESFDINYSMDQHDQLILINITISLKSYYDLEDGYDIYHKFYNQLYSFISSTLQHES